MLITGIYFVIGLAILAAVNVRRGRLAAQRADRDERRDRRARYSQRRVLK